MQHIATVTVGGTAANTDLLSGTDLENIPAGGKLLVWAFSSVTTCTIELNQPQHEAGVTNVVPEVGDATQIYPACNAIPPFVVMVKQGNRPKILIGGTTGTWLAVIQYFA